MIHSRTARCAATVTGNAPVYSVSSMAEIGCTSRVVEARKASSAAARSSSVQGASRAPVSWITRARVIEARMWSSSGRSEQLPAAHPEQ